MFKQALVGAVCVVSATISPANTQQPPTVGVGVTLAPKQRVQVPGTNYEFVLGSFEFSPDGNSSTDVLLTALVTWLSDNFDLPAAYGSRTDFGKPSNGVFMSSRPDWPVNWNAVRAW